MEILGDSRLPTRAEADELINKCKWEYNDRKKGYKVTGPNGNSIFLPLGGEKNDKNEIVSKDVLGYFWTFDRFNKTQHMSWLLLETFLVKLLQQMIIVKLMSEESRPKINKLSIVLT